MKRTVLFYLTMLYFACCIPLQYALAQQTVSGRVTDPQGIAISGASVMIKGGNQGTPTNDDGRFTLSVSPNTTLVITAVGFVSQEIRFTGQSSLNITLQVDETDLDEVMVVAYGTVKQSSFTGSAVAVGSQDIKDTPKPSFQEALIGKVPGLQVTTTSGQAGATPVIRIRGVGSMNASNSPLYVIDGVPVIAGDVGQMTGYISGSSNNVMSTLNPNDIESVTVLKDAAASSLYGSRAANGVIIITTKQGKMGKPKIDLRSSVSMTPSWATDNWEIAGPQDQINTLYRILHDARTSGGHSDEAANQWVLNRFNNNFGQHGYEFSTDGVGLYENVNIKGRTDGIENRDGKYFDWDKALFQTGIFQTNDLSVSGANETTRYYTSLGYTYDKSRMIQNDFNRFSGRVNLTQQIGKYFEFGSNVSISNQKTVGLNDTRNLGTNYFMQTRNLLWPFYWPTSYKTGEEWTARYGSLAYNPLYYNNERDNLANSRRISAIPSLTLKLLPELNIKTIFSYDEVETKDHVYYSANHFSGQASNGLIHEMSTNSVKMVSSTTANYNKTFQGHNIDALIGYEAEMNDTKFIRATGRNLPSSALHTVATAGELEANAYSWGNNMMSALSRLQYNYNEKYFASASFRRDGSSRVGPEQRWRNFYSVAGSWRLNAEDFFSDIEAIDDLRIRASYGTNGTLPTSNFGWRALTTYTNRYMEQAGGGLSNVADRNLKWEINVQTNIGLEFGLFKNKLFGSVEYFNRDSKDLLQLVPISTITGFSSTLRNVGQINNNGVEFLIGSDIIQNDDWRWSASVNGTFLNSKVLKLYAGPDGKGQDIIWNDPTGGDARTRFIYREGESTLAYYGIEWAGVDQDNGKNMWFVNDEDDPTAGDFLIDGRGASHNYGDANRIILGDAHPKMYGGLNTDVEYKGITLGLNFIYKLGGKLYDAASKDVADDGYYWERIRSQHFIENSWTDITGSGSQPKVSGQDLVDAMQISSRHLYDASFLRLRNISLAYRIPNHFTQRAGVNNARIYFNGANLLTFSKYKHADPEVNNYGTRGFETPIGKTYTFGLEFSF